MIRSEKALTRMGCFLVAEAGSGSADAFDHLTGAAAIFTFPCLGTAAAVANGADIFTRPGRSWRRFVSGIGR